LGYMTPEKAKLETKLANMTTQKAKLETKNWPT
jgi:hypothetical protein